MITVISNNERFNAIFKLVKIAGKKHFTIPCDNIPVKKYGTILIKNANSIPFFEDFNNVERVNDKKQIKIIPSHPITINKNMASQLCKIMGSVLFKLN